MTKRLSKLASRLLVNYYLGRDHPMKMRLWSWIRKISGYSALTVPYGVGGWIALDERDLVQREILVAGGYEPEVWDGMSQYLCGNEVVWDVGAHIGTFAIRALQDDRVRLLHAFEPNPASFSILAGNLALNGVGYHLHNIAIGDRSTISRLYTGPLQNTGISSLVNRPGSDFVDVKCATVDELVFNERLEAPTIMKIDVEGAESNVFRGSRRLLAEDPPRVLVLETDRNEYGCGIADKKLDDYLTESGYRIEHIRRPSGFLGSKENYIGIRS